jgi:DNA primase
VHTSRQFYHCFGCGASGDVFSFVQKLENITFPEAVRAVAQKLGIAIPKQAPSSPAEAKEARLRSAVLELHERAAAFFEEQLRRSEAAKAREYLASRGLTDEALKTFRIGYAPESGFLLRDRLLPGSDAELLKASGLVAWKTDAGEAAPLYARFRNRIIFPICNESGKVIAFTGRALNQAQNEKSGPKYLNSPETSIYSKSRVLFNLNHAREAIRQLDYAILVEGQMDCISVFMAGFHNVMASSGTAFTEAQVRLLGRYTRNVVVNFDPDAAGAAAAERSLGLLVAEDFRVKVLTLETGFDPDLYLRKRGKQAYTAALRNAPDYFDYLIERARASFPIKTPEGKVKAVNFLLPHLQRVASRIVRDELVNNMAQKLGIDSALLRQELKHAAATRAAAIKAPANVQISDAERILIRALSLPQQGDLQVQARAALADGLHQGLASETLLETLLAASESGNDPVAMEQAEPERRLLAATLMNEAEELTAPLLQQALNALRRRQLEHRQRTVKMQIAEAERRQDRIGLDRLIQEKLNIDKALAART